MLGDHANRHVAWRIGFSFQLLATVFMLLCGFLLKGTQAGIGVVVFLVVFSLSRALCSLVNKDIQGHHVKKGDRGKLIGSAGSISSVFSIIVGVVILVYDTTSKNLDINSIIILAVCALSAQVICILIMWPLKTKIDIDKSDDSSHKKSAQRGLKYFKNELVIHLQAFDIKPLFLMSGTLKTFIATRALFSQSALMAPLFTLAYTQNPLSILAWMIIAQASAGFVSSFMWGRLSDTSALYAMRLGALIAAISGMSLFIALVFASELTSNALFIVFAFFLLNIGHGGVRMGRKIYSVDIAQDHERTDFVAKSNSYIGLFILIVGGIFAFLSLYNIALVSILMVIGLLVGIGLSWSLPNEK